jgi:lipopolysaccharide transport system permease protein
MSVDSDNSNAVSQITAEAQDPGGSDPSNQEKTADHSMPIATTETTVVYSPQSEIRHPVQLLTNIVADFYAGRELAWRLFLRNLRGMYRQTFLGLFWAFLPPIANTAMWVFLRKAGVFETGETSVDGTVYILTGMILWQAFIDAFQMPLNAINKNRGMISKLNFPRESLLLVGYWEVLFDLCIRLLLLIPAFIFFQFPLNGAIWFAPLAIVGLVLFASALGLLIMPVGTLYQDVGRFVGMMIPFWMIITPIIYVPKTEGLGTLLNWVNPAAPLLLLSRDLLLLGTSAHLFVGLIFAAITLPLLILGLMIYRIAIPVLVERMNA